VCDETIMDLQNGGNLSSSSPHMFYINLYQEERKVGKSDSDSNSEKLGTGFG
jgi:hypothetical protein